MAKCRLKFGEAWVGLVLPCDPYVGIPDSGIETGVLSSTPVGCPACGRSGFSVPQDQAIMILEQERPEAAAWWKSKSFPQVGNYFGFAEDEAEIVSGVSHQRLIEVADNMMGDPNR